jgi:putative oxidoreductase
MLQQLLSTDGSWAGLLLRLTAGLIMFPHGAQHFLGWFGGYGYKGTMGWLQGTHGLPWFVSFTIIMLEFFGSILLVAGIGTRFLAVAMIGLMIGIIATSHWSNGFFMDWVDTLQGEGYEYHLLFIGILLALVLVGGGRYSVDSLLAGNAGTFTGDALTR